MPKNHPDHERAILHLAAARRCLRRLRAAHGKRCDCGLCDLSSGLRFMLDTVHSLLESEAVPFTPRRRQRRVCTCKARARTARS